MSWHLSPINIQGQGILETEQTGRFGPFRTVLVAATNRDRSGMENGIPDKGEGREEEREKGMARADATARWPAVTQRGHRVAPIDF